MEARTSFLGKLSEKQEESLTSFDEKVRSNRSGSQERLDFVGSMRGVAGRSSEHLSGRSLRRSRWQLDVLLVGGSRPAGDAGGGASVMREEASWWRSALGSSSFFVVLARWHSTLLVAWM